VWLEAVESFQITLIIHSHNYLVEYHLTLTYHTIKVLYRKFLVPQLPSQHLLLVFDVVQLLFHVPYDLAFVHEVAMEVVSLLLQSLKRGLQSCDHLPIHLFIIS
jgi:hypothetical protein